MTETAPGLTRTVQLSGFDFWPTSASRIEGLGGEVIAPDPSYAFHTKYVDLGNGVVRCAIRFTELSATVGSITIAVNGLPPGAGARAESVRVWNASLAEMADGEGMIEVSFQASGGSRYAVMGHIYTETDARARALEITLVTTVEAEADQRAATRKSLFGRRVFRRSNRMFTGGPATLADPVCQPCTAAQFREPSLARWAAEMKRPAAADPDLWRRVFVLQTLARYGMLRPGARGLGLEVGADPLPAVMASHGCAVLATDLPPDHPRYAASTVEVGRAQSIESLRFPEVCADEVFDRQVSFRAFDPRSIPLDIAGFDFVWSGGAMSQLGSVEAGLDFVRDAVACLTYGGLAVHTTDFNLSSNDALIEDPRITLFRRRDLERLAVDLISRGHYVAQFKYDFGPEPTNRRAAEGGDPARAVAGYLTVPFGLIVRRGER